MAYRLANDLSGPGSGEREALASPNGLGKVEGNGVAGSARGTVAGTVGTAGTAGGTAGTTGAGSKMDDDEERDAVFYRLEGLGYRVGQGLVERYVYVMSPCAQRLLCCSCLACGEALDEVIENMRWRRARMDKDMRTLRSKLTLFGPPVGSLAIVHASRIRLM
jgi:hypothetical protein